MSKQEELVRATEEEVYELGTAALTPAEEQLNQWFAEQRLASVTNLEQAACQLITLCTTLISLLLGVLALSKETLPSYLDWMGARLFGIVGIILFFIALMVALDVIRPRDWSVDRKSPDEQRERFDELLNAKSFRLQVAMVLFGGAMSCLVVIILSALWFG